MHHEAQKLTTTALPRRSAIESGAGPVEALERERRCVGMLPLGERAGRSGVVLGDLPDEQPEQPDDERDRDDLPDDPGAAGHAATMKTGVPTSTWVNSHSTCGISILMQPCEAE